jgi:predicted phage-related endonuclease
MNLPTHSIPVPHPHATKEIRHRVLTGTDARRIAAGEWFPLWQEKRQLVQPVDLAFVWKAKLGLTTEKLHAWWHSHVTGDSFEQCPDQPCYFPSVKIPAHHATTFDFWMIGDDVPLEVKHTNERNSLYEAAKFYMAQLQWQLHVCGRDRLRFSIIRGNNEPEWGWISRDQDYLDKLLRQADAFWQMVQNDIPPEQEMPADAELTAGAAAVIINELKTYSYQTNNEWAVKEAEFLLLKPKAEEFKQVEKDLRALIPKDAREVIGKGTSFKRDARGAYRCTVLDQETALV